MRRIWTGFAALTLLLTSCQDSSTPLDPETSMGSTAESSQVEDRYIVVFRSSVGDEDVDELAASIVATHSGRLLHTYHYALKGFAAELPDRAIQIVRNHPDVAVTEPDRIMTIIDVQANPTWGLDRIDQRDLPLDEQYEYTTDGSGVNAYVIDTGIRTTHVEFGGRASGAFTSINDGWGAEDCNGHGTHVAGTLGGTTYGVAKDVRLFSVRVLGCDGRGFTSGVIAGVDWVTANHVGPAVANMSLGGGPSSTLDDAVQASIAAGVTYTLSAGNDNTSACNGSPGRVPEGLTVGATNSSDVRASFSNFGTCLDLFAPGVSITSAWAGSDTQIAVLSGTSMAAPHVAGVAALYLEGTPGASPSEVSQAILSAASVDKVSSPGTGSPNLLLFTGQDDPAPVDNPPVADFTYSCSGLTCTFDASSSTDDEGIVLWEWSAGPGAHFQGEVGEWTFSEAGTYEVRLRVTDTAGQRDVTGQDVSVTEPAPVDDPPNASFTFSCTDLTCSFDSSGSSDDNGIVSRSWDFGSGQTAGDVVAPTNTYDAGGSYEVTLTVTDGAGQTDSQTQTVTVTEPTDAPPVAAFTWSCEGLTCTLDGSSSSDDEGIVRWEWAPEGLPHQEGTVVQVTFPAAGSYTVLLRVTDTIGQRTVTGETVTTN